LTGGPQEEKRAPEKPLDFIDQFLAQLDRLTKEKEQAERNAAEYLDRLKRLQADMENLQKITKRQLESVTKHASESLLVKLLPILDALEQAGKMAHSNKQLPPEEIAVGLKMLKKQLTEVLQTEGLEEIPSVGLQLDPERHEAVSFIETEDKPEGTILEEVRKGYLLNGKVIRPSLVVVSKPTAEKRVEEAERDRFP
jgi:molecular chaperone GrpE